MHTNVALIKKSRGGTLARIRISAQESLVSSVEMKMARSSTTVKPGEIRNPMGRPRTSIPHRIRLISELAASGDSDARKMLVEVAKLTAGYANTKG